jgi:hypothetical protein
MTIYMRLCVLCSSSSLDLHMIFTLAGEILPEINYTISYDPSESNKWYQSQVVEGQENQENFANTPADTRD